MCESDEGKRTSSLQCTVYHATSDVLSSLYIVPITNTCTFGFAVALGPSVAAYMKY